MNLFEITLNVVPFLFIALFLDLPRYGGRVDSSRLNGSRPREGRIEPLFELIVATLGLLAFIISLYAIGSQVQPDRRRKCRLGALVAEEMQGQLFSIGLFGANRKSQTRLCLPQA